MPTVEAPVKLTVDLLLGAVKQLSPDELRDFTRQFREWQKQNEAAEEASLLALVEENSRLPDPSQRRFDALRRKRQTETLTKSEETELQQLWQRVEQMNVARLEALSKLASRRGVDVRTLMRDLGLDKKPDVF